LIDVRKSFLKGSVFFVAVGSNSIFIYLFFSLSGAAFFARMVRPFSELFFSGAGELAVEIITSLGVWGMMWYMCYWLFMHKLFVKI
jgi:hypothetical protein